MPQFDISLFGPTSTSKCIEIATRFADDDGMIIQLNNNGENDNTMLKSFDCSWISRYSEEEEWLFFGSKYKMKIESVIFMREPVDFAPSFNALFYFDCMMNGCIMDFGDFNIESIGSYAKIQTILSDLINDRLSGNQRYDYAKYIHSTFKAYCLYKTHIIINLHQICKHFAFCSDLVLHFVEQTHDSNHHGRYCNIIRSSALKLFPNVKEITIQASSMGGVFQYSFDYLHLLDELSFSKQLFTVNNLKVTIKATSPFDSSREKMNTWA
eukprot:708130_1